MTAKDYFEGARSDIGPRFYVADQIPAGSVAAMRKHGVHTNLCNCRNRTETLYRSYVAPHSGAHQLGNHTESGYRRAIAE